MADLANPIRVATGRIQFTDVCALAWMAGHYTQNNGLHDSRLLGVFAVAWVASAAKRLSDLRRGYHEPLRAEPETKGTLTLALVLGSGPWLLVGVLYSLYPQSPLWSPLEVPRWLTLVGVVLALITVVRHPLQNVRTTAGPSTSFLPPVTPDTAALTLALFLTTGSTIIALMACLWIAATAGAVLSERRPNVLPVRRLSMAAEQI